MLPHFDPLIKEVRLYRKGSTTPIGPNEYVAPGTAVRVDAVIQNTNADAGSEQFPLHLKLLGSDHEDYPTKGISVTGGVATSTGKAVTLAGTAAQTVSMDATVTAAAGTAASIGLQLVDDSFGGTYENGAKLLNDRPLVPGDGTGSGAGTAWHYTRLPAANENGWNNSPVAVTFYPGEFDEMDLAPSGQAPVKLTAADPAWTQSADTAGTDLSAQARNTSTGAVSMQKAGKVKVDTSAPRIEKGVALEGYTATDVPAGSDKATSGVWRLYRTGASGAVGAARAAAFREFPLSGTDGDKAGNATEALGNLPNGYYVAEDAAGNLSAPLKVGETEPPAVDRPDPDAPDAPPPAGPVYDPEGDKVPDPVVTEDGEGLRHAVIDETVTETIDPAAPPFGGALDAAEAKAMMDYRYAATSTAAPLAVSDELLDADGNSIAEFATKVPGECLVRRTITDGQGNTTTINLRYRCVRDSCPVVRPWEPKDPSDPDGPRVPGEPVLPDGGVTAGPDGSQHAEVSVDATEAVTRGVMGYAGAEDLLRRHFSLETVDGSAPTLAVQSMEDASGNRLSAIDLSRVADYGITYLVRDADGNTTTVRLGYHLVSSHVPGVVVTPDPGEMPASPRPGADPLAPYPVDPAYPPEVAPDGTQHAVVEDEMHVKAREGASLDLADARSLVQRRYAFTPEGGGPVAELSLALADAKGSPVSAIDQSRPGAWLVTYKVADVNGNTVTVRLRYLVVSDAPEVTPRPGGDGQGGSGDSGGTAADPLPPTIAVDPETGLTHAVVRDTVTVATGGAPMTVADAADFMQRRYQLKSALADGILTCDDPRLSNASGAKVTAIDRSQEGDWLIELLVTDSAGNTTDIRLTYLVRKGDVSGSVTPTDPVGDNAGSGRGDGGGDGATGASLSNGRPSQWGTQLRALPQTGGPFGACPLHILFVLIMVLASAYTLMRLRQESSQREERRRLDDEWEEFCREAIR